MQEGLEISETIFPYDGRDIPVLIVGLAPEEEEQFVEAMAEFLWRNRHLADNRPG